MSKYKNTKFKVSFPEYIGLVVFSGLLILSLIILNNTLSIQGLTNIGKTKVDFIIQAPCEEQVSQISGQDHVQKIVPYYFRTISYSSKKGNISTSLFIINNPEDVEYTTFSNKLKITGSELKEKGILVTDDFAKAAGLKAGNEININVDGTPISFMISGIYKSDYRRVGGSLLILNKGNVSDALKSNKYNGAFISSNNISATASYLKNYRPEGDLRSADEFETEEAYQIYLETREQSDTTTEAFSTADYLTEVRRRNSERLIRGYALVAGLLVVSYLLIAVLTAIRSSIYTRLNVKKDIKDNFSYKQEAEMYFRYYLLMGILLVCASAIAVLVAFLLGLKSIIIPFAVTSILLSAIVICIVGIIEVSKMKKRHFVAKK